MKFYLQYLFLTNRNELIAIRDRLESNSSNVGTFVKKAATKPKEFNLKKKKPISIPEPEVFESQSPPHPIPETTYEKPDYLG